MTFDTQRKPADFTACIATCDQNARPGKKSIVFHKIAIVAATGLTLANGFLLGAGLQRRLDGWRRGAGLLFRSPESTFYLSTFGLDVGSDIPLLTTGSIAIAEDHVAERLTQFLTGEPDSHVAIRHHEREDRAEKNNGPCFTLVFEPWVDGPARFLRPEHWSSNDSKSLSQQGRTRSVLLSIVCRVSPSGAADVWVRANHVGIDGVPLQDLMTRLELAWGLKERAIFCSSEAFAPLHKPRDCGGQNGISEIQDFIDFSPVLAWRARENKRLTEPMTFSAALMWCLARHEEFADLHIGSTVEVPAAKRHGRGVGILTTRPADYFSRPDGLAQYVHNFNQNLHLTRRRKSRSCKSLDATAHIPRSLAALLIGRAVRQGDSGFGSLGLTVLRDARIFGAPMGDPSHSNGFIAIGSVALDAGNGQRVGCVTIKGIPAKIATYPASIRDAIRRIALT